MDMAERDGGSELLSFTKNVLLLGLLFILSLLFFWLVRNNTFWHSGDFLFLTQAMDTGQDWRQIFVPAPRHPFQPLVRLVFYGEFALFGLDAWKYYLFNILVHSINAFLVYHLVVTLLRDRQIAVLSSILFVFAVGNYGKAVMVVSGISDLLITMLTLLTLLFYFKNELEKGGRIRSWWFLWSLVFFTLSLLTKATSFSVLGCIFAFHFFFKRETGKALLNKEFMVMTVIALLALVMKLTFLPDVSGRGDLVFVGFRFFRNFGSYLVRMVFPIHASNLVSDSNPVVQFIYNFATQIRVVTFLCILSYSVFGFIFGNRTMRFFISWTYITVLPFCFFKFPGDWLNIRYLYLVSVGFVMILASGTVFASRLLYQKAWRRFLPYLMPLMFVLLSQFIIAHLDKNYEKVAKTPSIEALRATVGERYARLYGRG